MPLEHPKITAQGQVSVPAKVRQRLGVGLGSVLEWDEDGDRVPGTFDLDWGKIDGAQRL